MMGNLSPSAGDQLFVRTLWIRNAGSDLTMMQQRAANVLSTLSLRPAGLSPSAILCIRSLRDPRPGALRLRRADVRAAAAWSQAVHDAIDQLARRAVRPIHGPVPADSDAVLFADRSELLACLAMDWCADEAWSCWWWKGLFRNADIARAVLAAWLDAVEHAPPALLHLAAKSQAAVFAGKLSDATAVQLRQAIVRAFGLSELHSALNKMREDDAARGSESFAPARSARAGPAQSPRAPWRRWVPEADRDDLHVEQQCLLGIGLMLQRAPAIVRRPSFAHAAAEWYTAVKAASTASSLDEEAAAIQRPAIPARSPTPTPLEQIQRVAPPVAESFAPQPRISESDPSRQSAKSDESAKQALDWRDGRERAGDRSYPGPSAYDTTAIAASIAYQTPHAAPRIEPDGELIPIAFGSAPEVEVTQETGEAGLDYEIETEFGGIFYLINLGLFLNLYGDFTAPLMPGLALSIWDFIAVIGEALVGERLRADPVWDLLARLAGRLGDEPPGKDFEPPLEWRIPADWLAPFPEPVAWQWSHDGERMRVHHPAGFYVLDVPIGNAAPEEALRRELASVRESCWRGLFRPRNAADGKVCSSFSDKNGSGGNTEFALFELQEAVQASENFPGVTGLDCWLGWLMPYIRARLRLALGVDDVDVPRVLCEQRAHVTVTSTHLEIYLVLAELPIEVRLAGLDRDPGWVPAAGKFALFHFEV